MTYLIELFRKGIESSLVAFPCSYPWMDFFQREFRKARRSPTIHWTVRANENTSKSKALPKAPPTILLPSRSVPVWKDSSRPPWFTRFLLLILQHRLLTLLRIPTLRVSYLIGLGNVERKSLPYGPPAPWTGIVHEKNEITKARTKHQYRFLYLPVGPKSNYAVQSAR